MFINLGKLKMFLLSKLSKIEFLVMKFVFVIKIVFDLFGSLKNAHLACAFLCFFLPSDWSQNIVTCNLPSQNQSIHTLLLHRYSSLFSLCLSITSREK